MLAFVDLEMTGLDPARDRIVEICVERVHGARTVARIASLVDPGPCARRASEIHRIGSDELRGAPRMAELADRLVDLLEGAVLVAHAAAHDVAFLCAELGRCGRAWERAHYLDTLALSRRCLRLPSHRLGAVAAALGIDSPRPHRADNDVRVTRALLAHLVTAERPATVRDLWRTAAGARHVDPRIVARAGEALARGLPVRVSYLPSRGGRELLALRVTEVRADLDPPLVLGYLLLSRGRRELRADRILGLELATEG